MHPVTITIIDSSQDRILSIAAAFADCANVQLLHNGELIDTTGTPLDTVKQPDCVLCHFRDLHYYKKQAPMANTIFFGGNGGIDDSCPADAQERVWRPLLGNHNPIQQSEARDIVDYISLPARERTNTMRPQLLKKPQYGPAVSTLLVLCQAHLPATIQASVEWWLAPFQPLLKAAGLTLNNQRDWHTFQSNIIHELKQNGLQMQATQKLLLSLEAKQTPIAPSLLTSVIADLTPYQKSIQQLNKQPQASDRGSGELSNTAAGRKSILKVQIHSLQSGTEDIMLESAYRQALQTLSDLEILPPPPDTALFTVQQDIDCMILVCNQLNRQVLNDWLWADFRKLSTAPLIITGPWSDTEFEYLCADDLFFLWDKAYTHHNCYTPSSTSPGAVRDIIFQLTPLSIDKLNMLYKKGASAWLSHLGVRHFGYDKTSKYRTIKSFENLKTALKNYHQIVTGQLDISLRLETIVEQITKSENWQNIAHTGRAEICRSLARYLPIKKETQMHKTNNEKKSILLIDDNPGEVRWSSSDESLEDLLRANCKANNLELIVTTTRDEALQALDESQDSIGAILLDLDFNHTTPNDNGKDIAKMLDRDYEHIPIIVLTGVDDVGARRALGQNKNTYLYQDKATMVEDAKKLGKLLSALANDRDNQLWTIEYTPTPGGGVVEFTMHNPELADDKISIPVPMAWQGTVATIFAKGPRVAVDVSDLSKFKFNLNKNVSTSTKWKTWGIIDRTNCSTGQCRLKVGRLINLSEKNSMESDATPAIKDRTEQLESQVSELSDKISSLESQQSEILAILKSKL